MTQIIFAIGAIVAFITTAVFVWHGKNGWGWLLFIAFCMTCAASGA